MIKRNIIIFILITAMIMALTLTACSEPSQPETTPEPTLTPIETPPTPTPEPKSTPEPKPEIDLTENPEPEPWRHNLDPDIDYAAEFDFDIENDYIFIKNDIIQIFIPVGIEYSPDFEEKVLQAIHWVEETTGLDTLTNTGVDGSPKFPTITRDFLNDMDEDLRIINIFNQLADNRLTIFPVNYPNAVPAAYENSIQLPYEDYLFSDDSFDNFEFGILLHEFTHVAQFGYTENSQHAPFNEGFAVWTTVQVAKKQGLERLYQEQRDNYLNIRNIPSDMEEYFITGWPSDLGISGRNRTNRPYEAGYVFFIYLHETYGDEIFRNILEKFDKRRPRYHSSESSLSMEEHLSEESRRYIEDIKAATSPDVFQDFDAWFKLNRAMIS